MDAFRSGHLTCFRIFFQVKELKNVYTTRVNVQVTAAQQNLDVAQSSLAEIRQKVMLQCYPSSFKFQFN